MLAPWKKSYDQPRQHIKKERHYFVSKGPSSQSYGFSSGHVWMWELDYKEGWVPKNGCFWSVVLEKTLESPLNCKEIQPVHPKGNQSWIFTGRTDAEAEAPILWPPDEKNWLIGKDLDAGKDWRLEEKGMTEDEMVGWHHWLNGNEFESGSWWWTGRPGVLRSMGLQSVGREWATELNWPKSINVHNKYLCWFSETSPWYVEKKSVCPFTTLSPEDTALPSPTHCILSWLKASWSLNLNKQEQRLHLKTCDWNSS